MRGRVLSTPEQAPEGNGECSDIIDLGQEHERENVFPKDSMGENDGKDEGKDEDNVGEMDGISKKRGRPAGAAGTGGSSPSRKK